jgi:hypothetical protein
MASTTPSLKHGGSTRGEFSLSLDLHRTEKVEVLDDVAKFGKQVMPVVRSMYVLETRKSSIESLS